MAYERDMINASEEPRSLTDTQKLLPATTAVDRLTSSMAKRRESIHNDASRTSLDKAMKDAIQSFETSSLFSSLGGASFPEIKWSCDNPTHLPLRKEGKDGHVDDKDHEQYLLKTQTSDKKNKSH